MPLTPLLIDNSSSSHLPPSHSPTTSLSPPPPSSSTSSQSQCGSHLPEECIQEIFNHLSRDISTLHALLLVSKTFFRIAVPLLYSGPFALLESNETSWTSQERTRRHAQLLFLLMNCCTEHPRLPLTNDNNDGGLHSPSPWINLPPVSPTFQTDQEALKKPLVDYLAAYQHHYLCMNLSSTFPILFPNIQRQPLPVHATATPAQANTTITMFTRNEIERTLLLHHSDRIKTISLPIQRLSAFESVGPHLSSLVRFELFGVSWHFNLDPAIKFLQQHARLFGTIRELKLAGPNDVRLLQKPSLHNIMKAINNPKVIDLSRYKEATKDLNSYEIQNRESLEQLLFDLDFVPPPLPPPSPPSPVVPALAVSFLGGSGQVHEQDYSLDLIRTCPRLITLQIGVQSPTAFQWAVSRYDADPLTMQHLKTLYLSSNKTSTVKQALEDCVYAFRDTLEDLKGVALRLSPVDPALSEIPPFFGWTWPLHRLTVLSLRGELAGWFDMNSLKYCPKLTEFHLTLYPYSPVKVDYLESVVLAPHLKVLSLVGRWILTDRLLSVLGDGLSKLRALTVDGCEHDDLTGEGLFQGLDKMSALRTVEVELGQRVEALMREYRVGRARPDLSIRMRSDDAPWFEGEVRLMPAFRP
ncbi:MAG: hypothetical protein JOS17DRAFT_747846 [Linnemannia elongata]|nr:MAG: hypothetical protein JOS17DRAFT_747846 [Linnemannia elongata]